ncbi:MAG TPA: serine protease [Caulobacteraceae bacterium]|nr:serine protease [Caulobacteraceae bacterium]
MSFPRLPPWLVYPASVLTLLTVALDARSNTNAPLPPPPMPVGDGAVLTASSSIDPAVVVKVRARRGDTAGTAFSVSDTGVWLTARHVVEHCARAAIMVNGTQGVAARVRLPASGEAAVLLTADGAPALPLARGPLRRGQLGYEAGFPRGRPGEVAGRLLGRGMLYLRGRGVRRVPVLIWAEIGRTEGLRGALTGMSGAPAMDGQGRVVGVAVAEAPRRGRLYTTTPDALQGALTAARVRHARGAAGLTITADNYGLAADDLRRSLRIAPVVCVAK